MTYLLLVNKNGCTDSSTRSSTVCPMLLLSTVVKLNALSSGPISALNIMGQVIVILNDHRVAFDLFEKRSALHSSRPRMVFGGEMWV